ncbi:hypothetical protein BOTCAL_0088g00110 [Botryotinia calthae]|uniref:Uncharacterized protein n=1 Tax=Botryotinia calthae TaxID=38488 RepID=A0A4Y8D7Q7_9HELO|nr:hypothetical protein BOTCAL_0088g00110 [Botryotinia calthae]
MIDDRSKDNEESEIPENFGIVDNLMSVRCDMSQSIDDDEDEDEDDKGWLNAPSAPVKSRTTRISYLLLLSYMPQAFLLVTEDPNRRKRCSGLIEVRVRGKKNKLSSTVDASQKVY